MKFKDMKNLGAEERKGKMRELQMELIKLNTQVATGTPPKNAGTVSRIKKDIARLLLIEKMQSDKTGGASKQKTTVTAKAPAEKPKQVAKPKAK